MSLRWCEVAAKELGVLWTVNSNDTKFVATIIDGQCQRILATRPLFSFTSALSIVSDDKYRVEHDYASCWSPFLIILLGSQVKVSKCRLHCSICHEIVD